MSATVVESVKTVVPTPARLHLKGGGESQNEISNTVNSTERQRAREALAGAFRLFHKLGYDETIAGHISLRDPIDPGLFWMNPYGVPFDHICASDLLCIDHDGNVREGGQPGDGQIYNAAGFAIHGSIHHARPDIHAVAHSHSLYGKAFCMLGRNVGDDSPDYRIRLYPSYDGPVLDEEEGQRLCDALGPTGRGLILQNHGILTVAKSVQAVVAYFVRLEEICRTQLEVDAAGSHLELSNLPAAEIFAEHDTNDESSACDFARPLYDALEYESGDRYKT